MAEMVKRKKFLDGEVLDLSEQIALTSPTDTPLSPLILVRLCCRSFFFFVTFSIIHTALNVCTPKKIQNISTSLFLAFYSGL